MGLRSRTLTKRLTRFKYRKKKFVISISFMLQCLISAPLTECRVALSQRKRTHLPPACTNTLPRPGTTITILFVKFNETERQCCGCNPGYKLKKLCEKGKVDSTECVPCEPGSYMTKYAHGERRCVVDDRKCSRGKIKIPAEPDQEPRCDCPPGEFLTKVGRCKGHTPCPPGMGVDIHGTTLRDTSCSKCASGYDSPTLSTTEVCALSKELINENDMAVTEITPQVKLESVSSAGRDLGSFIKINDGGGGGNNMVFSHALVGCGGFVLAVVAWFVYRMVKRHNIFQHHRVLCQTKESVLDPSSTEPLQGKNNSSSMLTNTSAPGHQQSQANNSPTPQNTYTVAKETEYGVQARKLTAFCCRSTANSVSSQYESREDSYIEQNQDQGKHQHLKTMNALKLKLADRIHGSITGDLWRYFTVTMAVDQEAFLRRVAAENRLEKDRFYAVFDELLKLCTVEEFSPETLRQHFHNVGNLLLAEFVGENS